MTILAESVIIADTTVGALLAAPSFTVLISAELGPPSVIRWRSANDDRDGRVGRGLTHFRPATTKYRRDIAESGG